MAKRGGGLPSLWPPRKVDGMDLFVGTFIAALAIAGVAIVGTALWLAFTKETAISLGVTGFVLLCVLISYIFTVAEEERTERRREERLRGRGFV